MSNPLTSNSSVQNFDPRQSIQELKSNPSEFLKRMNLNVPSSITSPDQIINHLMQTGQISSPRLAMAQKMAQLPRILSMFK